ncbi:MAG: glycosyltransferase family 4 protein [Gulosibacter sp.]|uniref:glycosyltransferase family 4 protein n=1 Tax=Gulosibacter sp. TaxID=2817531 RepID=UPI003F8DC98B
MAITLRRPWSANLSLIVQSLSGHIVDDPFLLSFQLARRLPGGARLVLGRALTSFRVRGPRGVNALGYELVGNHEEARTVLRILARRILDRDIPRARTRYVPYVADVAISIGQLDIAERLLEAVPKTRRGASWYATASRLALDTGDLDAAVSIASRHPVNDSLARRMIGEREAFSDFVPTVPREHGYTPHPGRVLHVLTNSLPHTKSGYAQRTQSILRSLVSQDREVRAVTRPGYPAQVGVLWSKCVDQIDGIPYVRLTPRRLATGLDNKVQQHAEMLAEQVREFRPEVLHTTTHFTNALAVRAVAEAFGIPWVYEIRGLLADTWASNRGAAATRSQRYQRFVARELEVAKDADAVVTLGFNMVQRLVKAGIDADKISLSPNAVDGAFLAPAPTRNAARKALGIVQDALYIGTVSSLVEYEGIEYLLEAAARLAPEFPKLRVRIAGDGVSLPGLQLLAERLGISDICEFPGRVDHSQAIWNHAALDVFVAPRLDRLVTRNVTPMKTIEASAVARPVVASRLPALEELVIHRETGMLFEAENIDSLTEALAEILRDEALRDRLGAAAREWALETRTWAANAKTYAEIYSRVLTREPVDGIDAVGDDIDSE